MKICENGYCREMTAEEIEEINLKKQNFERNKFNQMSYEELVVLYIRERYSIDEELAIQRQKETKPDEWEAYFAYCEECKKKAKQVLEAENE